MHGYYGFTIVGSTEQNFAKSELSIMTKSVFDWWRELWALLETRILVWTAIFKAFQFLYIWTQWHNIWHILCLKSSLDNYISDFLYFHCFLLKWNNCSGRPINFVTENKIWDIFLLRNFRENPWYTIDHLVLWKLFSRKRGRFEWYCKKIKHKMWKNQNYGFVLITKTLVHIFNKTA